MGRLNLGDRAVRAGVQEQTRQARDGWFLGQTSGSGGKCLFYAMCWKGHELALVNPVQGKENSVKLVRERLGYWVLIMDQACARHWTHTFCFILINLEVKNISPHISNKEIKAWRSQITCKLSWDLGVLISKALLFLLAYSNSSKHISLLLSTSYNAEVLFMSHFGSTQVRNIWRCKKISKW